MKLAWPPHSLTATNHIFQQSESTPLTSVFCRRTHCEGEARQPACWDLRNLLLNVWLAPKRLLIDCGAYDILSIQEEMTYTLMWHAVYQYMLLRTCPVNGRSRPGLFDPPCMIALPLAWPARHAHPFHNFWPPQPCSDVYSITHSWHHVISYFTAVVNKKLLVKYYFILKVRSVQ